MGEEAELPEEGWWGRCSPRRAWPLRSPCAKDTWAEPRGTPLSSAQKQSLQGGGACRGAGCPGPLLLEQTP